MVIQPVNHPRSKNIIRFVELFFSKEGEIPQQKFWFHCLRKKSIPIFCF